MSAFHALKLIAAAALIAAAGACDLKAAGPGPAPVTIDVEAKLKITQDGRGAYDFTYDSPYSDADGNFDFSVGEAAKASVRLTFRLADDSGLGIKFKPNGTDAIWIVDKKNVGPDGSPQGPYEGRQFRDFKVSEDGLSLSLFNRNDDGVLYRYGLRFDRGEETVIDDPDNQNGSGGNNGGN